MKRRILILLTIVAFAVSPQLESQWIQTNGPYGGKVTAFMSSDSILFASNYTNVFRSTNSGNNWTQVATDLPGFYNINSFAKIGTNVFAGTYDGGVFRSTNNGTDWTAANSGLPISSVTTIVGAGTNLYVGTWGSGIYLSTDRGASWAQINSGLTTMRIGSFSVNSSRIFAITSDGLFSSTNNGANWTQAKSGLPNSNGNVFPFCCSDSLLFCAIDGNGVFRSTDNGTSWIQIDSSVSTRHVHTLFMNNSTLFAVTSGDVLRSTDRGALWTPANSGLPDPSYVSCFGVSGPNLFAGCWYNGAFRSTDNGTSWTEINQGISLIVGCVAVNGSSLYAGTFGGGIFLTTNGGESWTRLSNKSPSDFVNALVVTDTRIFASNGGSNGHGPEGNVNLSTDNGQSWISVNSNLTNTNVWALASLGANIFAGTEGAGVFRSSNNGTSWIQVGSGLSNDTVWALAASGTNIFAGTQDGLCLSTNNGTSWAKINIQMRSGWKFKSVIALAARGDSLFAATDTGDYFSIDNGVSWTLMPGLSKNQIQCLASTTNFLFAGTSLGVWKIPMSVVTAVEPLQRDPRTTYNLEQNYPNPFNPSTTICFELQKEVNVCLRVFNTLGQLVATLVDEPMRAGTYNVRWDASKIPSGTYFYRLQTTGFVETRKMIVVK
jgi:photosystem II stability/assembly factor-like uncharacterized protein